MPTHWIVEARVNDTRKGVRAAGASRRPSSRAARASSSEDQKGPRDHAGRTSEVRWRTGTATRRNRSAVARRGGSVGVEAKDPVHTKLYRRAAAHAAAPADFDLRSDEITR